MTIERVNITYISGEEVSYSFSNKDAANKFLITAQQNPLVKDVKIVRNGK